MKLLETTSTIPTASHPVPTGVRGWLAGRKAAAAYLDVSPRTINRWMSRGAIRFRKLSPKLIMFRPADLDAAVEMLAKEVAG